MSTLAKTEEEDVALSLLPSQRAMETVAAKEDATLLSVSSAEAIEEEQREKKRTKEKEREKME